MFVFVNAIKNLRRNLSRNVLTALLLIAALTVASCAFYYQTALQRRLSELYELYHTRLTLKFREELQWLGNEYYYDGMGALYLPQTNETVDFNSDGSMDVYNEPFYVDRDYFERLADSGYIRSFSLAYTENVYGVYADAPLGRSLLYGGAFDGFSDLIRDVRDGIALSEGRLPSSGECVIHKDTAVESGCNIGDALTVYDKDGLPLITLTVSGLFDILGENDAVNLRVKVGSNPFYASRFNPVCYAVITDFDSVYNLYGEDNPCREFNSYSAVYTLRDSGDCAAFTEYADPLAGDNYGFYTFTEKYNTAIATPQSLLNTARVFVLISALLSMIISAAALMYNINERRREIGVMYSVGASKAAVMLNFLYETLAMILSVSLIAVVTGIPAVYATLGSLPLDSSLSFGISGGYVIGLLSLSLLISLPPMLCAVAVLLKTPLSALVGNVK